MDLFHLVWCEVVNLKQKEVLGKLSKLFVDYNEQAYNSVLWIS